MVIGLKGRKTTLFTEDGEINPTLPKAVKKSLEPEKLVVIQQQNYQNSELDREIQQDLEIANVENETSANH